LADKKRRSLRQVSILIVIVAIYVVLMAVALLYYPETFSPLTNIPAQLGNPVFSPSGALFYNIGILVSIAPIFVLVFLQMTIGRRQTASFDKRGKAFFYLTGIFLLLFAVFYILSLLFPMGINDMLNWEFFLILFSSFQLFAVFSAAGVRRNPGHLRWVPYLGFSTALINTALLVSLFFAGLIIANWIIIALSWTYVLNFVYEIS
jgi:hypothetical protein